MVDFDRPFSAISSRFKTIAARATSSPRFIAVTDAASVRIKALAAAPPKSKAIAAGALLVFMTGLSAPVLAATQTAPAPTPLAIAAAAESSTPRAPVVVPGAQTAATAPAPAAPTVDQLHPTGIQGSQVGFTPTTEQMHNAQMIIQAGQALGLPPRAWVIAVATSLQETGLHNYGDLGGSNDHDSLGLFQQRPSSGWGSPDQLVNPTYSSEAFYKALTQVPNWDKLNLTDAAQAVQVSAFGDRYAQWEAQGGDIVDAFYGHGPLTHVAFQVM
jgi:hypothetical protein